MFGNRSIHILVFVLFQAAWCAAQGPTLISGHVYDSFTMAPLAYVSIGIQGSSVGTVSNVHGSFELKVEPDDHLVLSYIGYKTMRVAAGSAGIRQIMLAPQSYLIDEVQVISEAFDQKVLLGVRNEDGRGPSIGFGNAQLGTELGALIRIDKETLVKSVNFVLNHAGGDSLLLRVNIYDYSNEIIGENVLKANITFQSSQRTGTVSIDVEEHNIVLTDDVLLSLEWLRDFDETGNKAITFDMKKSKELSGTFIRLSKTSDFMQVQQKFKPCIYFIGKQSS